MPRFRQLILAAFSALWMVGCNAVAEHSNDRTNDPGNPFSPEAPPNRPSTVLNISIASAEMGSVNPNSTPPALQPATTQAAAYFTCVMHPQIHQDHGGKCPICGMELIHVIAGHDHPKGGGQ